MFDSDPNLAILRRVAKKDSTSFEQLYSATSGILFSVAMKMLQNKDLAEEVLQETYVQIWHSASEYQTGRGKVLTWMVSILRYRVLDLIRYNKVRKSEADATPSEDIALEDDNEFLQLNEKELLSRCLGELEGEQHQAIFLAYFKGMSHGEVTTHMDKPLGTIKAWIRRGLQSLQRCLSA